MPRAPQRSRAHGGEAYSGRITARQLAQILARPRLALTPMAGRGKLPRAVREQQSRARQAQRG